MKAILDAMTQANFKHCTSIRLWRGKCQDEGARLISTFIIKNHQIEVLELLDCLITPLGCEFLNQAFTMHTGG